MPRFFLISFFLFLGTLKLSAQKFRENISFGITNSYLIPGPLSHGGSFFTGHKTEFYAGYTWTSNKSHWGMESDLGLSKIIYISKFDKNVSLSHQQTLLAIHLLGSVKISSNLKLVSGLSCFFPINYRVMVTGKNYNSVYSFGNSDLNSGYDPTKIQAGAILGLEYLIGKKQKWKIGMFVTQMGNGPVKSKRDFSTNGIPVLVSNNLKPIHFDFRIAFHLGKKTSIRSANRQSILRQDNFCGPTQSDFSILSS